MRPEIVQDAVGIGAALCSMSSFVPQIIKIWKDKHAASVSLWMYLVTVTGFALWTFYGVLLGKWPLIASNAISLALSATVLALTLHFGPGDKEKAGESAPA